MSGTVALYLDRSDIQRLNQDAEFLDDETFRSRDKSFKLPRDARVVGVEIITRVFDAYYGVSDDVYAAVTIMVNGECYAARQCRTRTVFECEGNVYSLPLSRVDIGKLLEGRRPRCRLHGLLERKVS